MTAVKDAVTALALIAGGLFTYLKFVKGRILGPRVSLGLSATTVKPIGLGGDDPATLSPIGTGRAIEVRIQNTGQIQIVLPAGSEQLLSISSATARTVFEATALDAEPVSWKSPDAYFSRINLLLDEGVPLRRTSESNLVKRAASSKCSPFHGITTRPPFWLR